MPENCTPDNLFQRSACLPLATASPAKPERSSTIFRESMAERNQSLETKETCYLDTNGFSAILRYSTPSGRFFCICECVSTGGDRSAMRVTTLADYAGQGARRTMAPVFGNPGLRVFRTCVLNLKWSARSQPIDTAISCWARGLKSAEEHA